MDIKKAQLELDLFISNNPYLQQFQIEIDQALNTANSQEQRYDILNFFIRKNLKDLDDHITDLNVLIEELVKELND